MPKNIGFVSTRFAGTDGVSLESAKWAEVLWDDGHVSYWYAGRLDRAPEMSMCVPEAHFDAPENRWINDRIWGTTKRSSQITSRIWTCAEYLKETLYEFRDRFNLDVLVVQNALTIPMHVPLGVAITQFLAETDMPSIIHHHDFYWERTRFSVNAVCDFLDMSFPPRSTPEDQHVVINKAAQDEIAWRKGIPAVVIPNVLEFEKTAPDLDDYNRDLREEIGLTPDDIMFLQPTRIVPRKGIEHALQLIRMLDDPRYKLVVSHNAGDEGMGYLHMLQELAEQYRVDMRLIGDRVGDKRHYDGHGRKVYTLWDVYPHANLVTYPSLYEGFGNAFLEAIYFRKPIVINRYPIFTQDIEPHDFRLIVMDGFVTGDVVEHVQHVLEDKAYLQQMTDHNYQIAARNFGHGALKRRLRGLLSQHPYF